MVDSLVYISNFHNGLSWLDLGMAGFFAPKFLQIREKFLHLTGSRKGIQNA
jgi:hypothetical protein